MKTVIGRFVNVKMNRPEKPGIVSMRFDVAEADCEGLTAGLLGKNAQIQFIVEQPAFADTGDRE